MADGSPGGSTTGGSPTGGSPTGGPPTGGPIGDPVTDVPATDRQCDDRRHDDRPQGPPLGSWARLYTLVCVLAVVVMALLWWFTSHYNLPLPN